MQTFLHPTDSALTPDKTGVAAAEIKGLTKLSLAGLDLTIASCERVAVIGKTGEGKSVLLKCLLGLLRADAGTIRLLGEPVVGRPVTAAGLGVAFQNPGLFDNWSVAENLRVASREPIPYEEIKQLLHSVDLSTVLPDAAVTQLSGGQQKRLALLRALLRGSQFVVLDEPTSGLDPGTASKIAEMLNQSFERNPRSLLLVTHDYETAARLCVRILLLNSEGHLQDVTPNPGTDRDEVTGDLRRALASNAGHRAVISARRPMPWGTLPLTLDFLSLGLPVAFIAMTLIGAMLVAQSAGIGPIDISARIPGALVLAVFREMAPLLVGLLLASRIGARVGSELAGMSYTSQLDSMRVLGLSPASRLLVPFLVSACIVFPIAIVSSGILSIFAGSFYAGLPISGLSIGTSRFLDLASEAIDAPLILSCILKGVVMATLIVVGSYWSGTKAVSSAPELGSAVTRAAVLGSGAIIVADVVLSWIFFA